MDPQQQQQVLDAQLGEGLWHLEAAVHHLERAAAIDLRAGGIDAQVLAQALAALRPVALVWREMTDSPENTPEE